ncbi:MAG: LysR family transcriptional regulator [Rudaea sp.]|uniref:LysR family transcriptional regulator n=1 Tax=Rudaea sp. TaxID=2136325 RepID=UPI0039E346A1
MTPTNSVTRGGKTAAGRRRPGKPRAAVKRGADAESARFYYKGSRLKQLRAFCYAVKFGTVVRAAESLFLSPSSVSLQLSALESDFGARLLERTRPRLALTADGQLLYDLARPLVEGMENLDHQFRNRRTGEPAREIHIACGNSTIQYLLPEWVRAYREQFPDVRLELANVTGIDGLALLRSDKVDFAVGSMLDVPHDIEYEPVRWFDPMLIVPHGHPLADKAEITLEDISPWGLILPPQRLTTYRMVDLVFQQRKVPYHVAIEVGGWEVIKQYVGMGQGISIVTGICIAPSDEQRLVARNLRRYFPQRSYGVVVRKGKYLSEQSRAFIDLIKPDLFGRRDYYDTGHSKR